MWAREDDEEKDSKYIYEGIERLSDKCKFYLKFKMENRLWLWKISWWWGKRMSCLAKSF